jgi:V/A-type H+-transporting ATPase subunit I
VFRFLGTVPGYREHDISLWFLVFFSVFFAMLIGDGGYGLLFVGMGLAARFAGRERGPVIGRVSALIILMGAATVCWGAMTGTWFGAERLSRLPILRIFVVPAVSSFSDSVQAADSTRTVMHLCFVIGAVHLTIARLLAFLRRVPRLVALAHLGWIAVLWGMYFVIRMFVLGDDMHPAALPLILSGFGVVVLFSEQRGRPLRDIAAGLAKAPLKALDIIGAFSDVVSYVRLFAVGLATLEVARAFNAMASGSGTGFGVGSVLVLFFGHLLNIVLGSMALLVHGVRLNMLEFSGHLEMEWGGTEYRPLSSQHHTED